MNDANPYAPPRSTFAIESQRALPLLPEHQWDALDVRVESVDRGWWTRRVRLTGHITAELLYDPSGHGERVYLNGQLLATTPLWQFSSIVSPHIDFHLETNHYSVPASIDVAASVLRLLRLTRFELTVAGKTIYKE